MHCEKSRFWKIVLFLSFLLLQLMDAYNSNGAFSAGAQCAHLNHSDWCACSTVCRYQQFERQATFAVGPAVRRSWLDAVRLHTMKFIVCLLDWKRPHWLMFCKRRRFLPCCSFRWFPATFRFELNSLQAFTLNASAKETGEAESFSICKFARNSSQQRCLALLN